MSYPDSFRYTKDHEWAKLDGKVATIGITDHAQNALGDIVFVDLPKTGRDLKEHEAFGVVESIKAVSDLYSPLAGKVTAVNADIVENPSLINREPHAGAWLIKIELTNPGDISKLMDVNTYEGYVKSLK